MALPGALLHPGQPVLPPLGWWRSTKAFKNETSKLSFCTANPGGCRCPADWCRPGFWCLVHPVGSWICGRRPQLPALAGVAVLALCGVLIVREALTGGFRELEQDTEDSPAPYWPGFIWVSAGLLANAALITTIGFILSCTLCFMLAVQGCAGPVGRTPCSLQCWSKT